MRKLHLTGTMLKEAAEAFIAEQRLALNESSYDPGILKCVFMAGGPGSGKSYTAEDIFGIPRSYRSSFSTYGLKVVNSDAAFEYMLNKNGVSPKDLAAIERHNPDLWNNLTKGPDSVREIARRLTQAQQRLFMQGKLGIIMDMTGDNFRKLQERKDKFEAAGYDTFMVFVNTTLEVALKRNASRPRQLPESLVTQIWAACQENREAYKDLFGDRNFWEIDKSGDNADTRELSKAIYHFLRRPIENPVGQEWLLIHGAVSMLKR